MITRSKTGKNPTKYFFLFSFFCLLLTTFAPEALAAEYGYTASEWLNLIWRLMTFGLVIAVIWYFAGKKAVSFFRGRKSGIEQELHDFEVRKEEARKNLQDVEKRIANLETERQALLEDYKLRAEAMAAEIVAKAEERATQITAHAKQTASSEIELALASMRTELAEALAEATRGRLMESLTPQQHEKLIDSFLNKVVLQ